MQALHKKQSDWLKELKPAKLWEEFHQICQIPHESGNEAKLREYIISRAEENNLKYKTDKIGNLVVYLNARHSSSDSPVAIQAHLDMICEKRKSYSFDFNKTPIPWEKEGDYILSKNTTLGADNGIAVAICLLMMSDQSVVHPPIELIFTIDEEGHLTGAKNLDRTLISSKRIINLDFEESDSICVGCAHGIDQEVSIPIKLVPAPEDFECFNIKISGGIGGHSGLDIHRMRSNAIKLIGKLLIKLNHKMPLLIADVSGGSKRNSIPRDASATIAISIADRKLLEDIILEFKRLKFRDFSDGEKINIELTEIELGSKAKFCNSMSSTLFIDLVNNIPTGIIKFNSTMPNLVETSSNLATVALSEKYFKIYSHHRSNTKTGLDLTSEFLATLARTVAAKIEFKNKYSGWQPNPESKLLKTAISIYKSIFTESAKITTVHAGLECGILLEVLPETDIISIGPDIFTPHTPGEKVSISSVEKSWKFLTGILGKL